MFRDIGTAVETVDGSAENTGEPQVMDNIGMTALVFLQTLNSTY